EQHQRPHTGTGQVAAAMIAPTTETIGTGQVSVRQLGLQSWALWPGWLKALQAASGINIAFNRHGTLVVAHPQDRSEWQRFQQRARQLLKAGDSRIWTRADIQAAEPELAARFTEALYFPQEGTLDNDALYRALDACLDAAPAVTRHEGLACHALRADGYVPELEQYFDRIVDCRGLGARAALPGLRGVRGEVIRVQAPEVTLQRSIRLLHPRYPLYIAPRPCGCYVIGATQLESEAETPVSVRSALELLSALYSLHPGFAEARILSLQTGLRPALPDHLPRLTRSGKRVCLNGLFRHGYLFAPALIHQAINLLEENHS
ncbi:MAG: FAD-dependent oxidoreductase, partial [Thiothrix sp.]|nr:FAD-dependent oxidoreductase [Thiothrix sp.]